MFDLFRVWYKEAKKLKNGEISKEEYDHWRYNYPEGDSSYKRVPSKEFSDAMVKGVLGEKYD
jgi:hypothetical protein